MKKNPPIIFIHYGFSDYLPYSFEAAKISNPDKEIILIGDKANKKTALKYGLKHYYFDEFDYGSDVELFKEIYELIATKEFDSFKHGKDWNEFVFRKWFILNNFLKKFNIQKFWHFDSDVVIVSDLKQFEPRYDHLDCTVQCSGECMKGYFSNNDVIERYIKKINEVYQRKDYMDKFKKMLFEEYQGPGCFNEMTVYGVFRKEENIKDFNLKQIDNGGTFDDLICASHGFEVEKLTLGEDCKVVHMNKDGRFFVIDKETSKPILLHAFNLSWMPPYLFKGILDHYKKHKDKEVIPFDKSSKRLPDIKVSLWRRFKKLRKDLKKRRKNKV